DKSFSEFSFLLEGFYQIPTSERTKSQIDQFLNRPMDCSSFESVHLTFRTAQINEHEIRDIASWAHNMLRLHYEKTSPVASIDLFNKAICDVIHPGFDEKDHDIDFEDFCQAWTAAVTGLYGEQFAAEHLAILSELRDLDHGLKTRALRSVRPAMLERIYLTQTEIDWVERSLKAVNQRLEMPRYPLSKGPTKARLSELLKWLILWEVTKTTKAEALQNKVQKLRNYIQGECEWLLANCRR
ncbi:MAG: hypothetical protein H7256_09140, partial [Bdellovibrio sp.]|nr:hypothetical protein [Bdellovibrio sp.]